MAIARGTNIITDGLIYGYDSGYGVSDPGVSTRFYKGKPTTNIASGAAFIHDTASGSAGSCVDAPEKGPGWKKVTITAIGTNFRVVQFGSYPTMAANVFYSSSFEADWGNIRGKGYVITQDGTGGGTRNYFKNGSYATGSTAQVAIDSTLSNGHIGMNITRTATHVHVPFIYNTGSTSTTGRNDYFYYKEYQQEVGTIPTPYVTGTRSATASLIDLKRTVNVDVSNVSFDSTGQPDFDGTDDRIVSSTGINLSSYTSLTYEGVVKAVGLASHDRWFSGTSGSTFHNPDLAIGTDGQLLYIFANSGIGSWIVPNGLKIDTTKFNHLVYTFTNTGVVRIYINGTQQYTATHSNATFPNGSRFMTGSRFDNNGEAVDGSIPITKVYSRALTAAEVTQNYKAYKNRFNI
jgi:hypothetical protein